METDNVKTCILSCDVVRDELLAAAQALHVTYPIFWTGSGLHNYPEKLRESIQALIDEVSGYQRILLATGFCGDAFCGIASHQAEIIIPRTDDCISFLLGSCAARRQITQGCGTYFLTAGWLRSDKSILEEYRHTCKRYGIKRANAVFKVMFAHYSRIAVIDTGAYDIGPTMAAAGELAQALGLRCERIDGRDDYLLQLLTGPWPEEKFLTLAPGTLLDRDQLMRLY